MLSGTDEQIRKKTWTDKEEKEKVDRQAWNGRRTSNSGQNPGDLRIPNKGQKRETIQNFIRTPSCFFSSWRPHDAMEEAQTYAGTRLRARGGSAGSHLGPIRPA